MVIRHNDAADRANRALQGNNAAAQKALKRLSSGMKLNGAADNAAGLAISQKMQAQINGLGQAGNNTKDAVSYVQTAEGTLAQAQDVLQKLNELAVQAQNGTLTDSDQKALQKEGVALQECLDQLISGGEFNNLSMFDPSTSSSLFAGGGVNIQIGADEGQTLSLSLTNLVKADWVGMQDLGGGAGTLMTNVDGTISNLNTDGQFSAKVPAAPSATLANVAITSTGVTGSVTIGSSTFDITDVYSWPAGDSVTNASFAGGDPINVSFRLKDQTTGVEFWRTSGLSTLGSDGTLAYPGGAGNMEFTEYFNAEQQVSFGGQEFTAQISGEVDLDQSSPEHTTAPIEFSLIDDKGNLVKGPLWNFSDPTSIYQGADMNPSAAYAWNTNISYNTVKGISLSDSLTPPPDVYGTIGKMSTLTSQNSNGLYISAADATALGVSFFDGESTERLSLSSKQAIPLIQNAINNVSTFRAQLGAYQNRLDKIGNNLTTEGENLTRSLSNIVDVDMAKEMTEYTKTNILQQSAQAMLAQANQLPQGTLSLLSGK